MSIPHRIPLFVGLLLMLLMLLNGCNQPSSELPSSSEKTTPAPPGQPTPATATPNLVHLSPAEQQAVGLVLGTVQQRPLGTGLAVSGTLDVPPESAIAITAPLGGFIESTQLLQGTYVRKGEVLAVLRNPAFVQLQQDYLEAAVHLRYAQADLARQRELYQQEVAPQKNFQRAEAEASALQVQTQALAQRLRLAGLPVGGHLVSTAAIRAPRSAFVRTVNVSIGQSVTAMEPLFELVDPSHLHVELAVFEQDLPRIHPGQLIRFTLPGDSATGRERTARVHLISHAINGTDRTARVHGHLDHDNDPALLPGLYVRAIIETGRSTVATVPDAALVRFAGQTYGFVPQPQQPGTFRMVPFRTGRSEDGYTELHLPATMPASTPLVIKGAYSLLAKLKNTGEEE